MYNHQCAREMVQERGQGALAGIGIDQDHGIAEIGLDLYLILFVTFVGSKVMYGHDVMMQEYSWIEERTIPSKISKYAVYEKHHILYC